MKGGLLWKTTGILGAQPVKPLEDPDGNIDGHWSIFASWEFTRTVYSPLTTSRCLEGKQEKQVYGIKPYQPALHRVFSQSEQP